MGFRDRLSDAGRLATAAREATASSPHLKKVGDGFRGLREFANDDGSPVSPERFLLGLVHAVRVDDRVEERSTQDVYDTAVRRRRRLGMASFAAGPLVGVANQLTDLYCEAAVVCDLSDVYGLGLDDAEVASHVLVLWSVTPSLDEARAAMYGTGDRTVTEMLRSRAPVPDAGTPLRKRDAIKALWKARGVGSDLRKSSTTGALGGVAFPGRRTRQLIDRAGKQLGLA